MYKMAIVCIPTSFSPSSKHVIRLDLTHTLICTLGDCIGCPTGGLESAEPSDD